jgi:hypothetical protein
MHYWINILNVRVGRVYSMHEGDENEVEIVAGMSAVQAPRKGDFKNDLKEF